MQVMRETAGGLGETAARLTGISEASAISVRYTQHRQIEGGERRAPGGAHIPFEKCHSSVLRASQQRSASLSFDGVSRSGEGSGGKSDCIVLATRMACEKLLRRDSKALLSPFRAILYL